MIFAVEHSMGLSLYEAKTPEAALEKARRRFGSFGGPYILPKDQEGQIIYAKAMGAGVS